MDGTPFSCDAGQKEIRVNSFALENLYDGVHKESASNTQRGRPCFHTGSVVTTTVHLISGGAIQFRVDSTGVERSAKLPSGTTSWQFFVSLYNCKASFTVLEVEVLK